MKIKTKPNQIISLKTAFILGSVICAAFIASALIPADNAGPASPEDEWISLFNGENLEGWIPKFKGYESGINLNNTFRVEDGLLTVSYDEWEQFDGEYGHLFYMNEAFSHYKLRAEYRFIGEQVAGGEGWAIRNNGLMLHGQHPETMAKDQEFPVSIEVQLLGGNGKDERTTANLCTPGTNVVIDNELFTPHCTNSTSKTYHGDQWVTVEVEVRGSEVIKHFVEGEQVLDYTDPQYDEQDATAQPHIEGGNLLIDEGYISIQAESHPTQFRKLEVLPLDK